MDFNKRKKNLFSDTSSDPQIVNLTIDVTIPIQCLVRDSKLKLQQSSKVRIKKNVNKN